MKVVGSLESLELDVESAQSSERGTRSMAKDELNYTTKMINENLSNFSAWHNRSQLIPRLLSERHADHVARRAMLDSELELITRALYTDPYDQSLWFYHQFLLSTFDPANSRSVSILEPCGQDDRVKYLGQEIESVREMLDGAEDCKYIYQALLEYSERVLEIGGEDGSDTKAKMGEWLAMLKEIDPLRAGRWKDWGGRMRL